MIAASYGLTQSCVVCKASRTRSRKTVSEIVYVDEEKDGAENWPLGKLTPGEHHLGQGQERNGILLSVTNCLRLSRKSLIHARSFPLMSKIWSLRTKISLSTLLNAFAKSRYTTSCSLPSRILWIKLSICLRICVRQLGPFLKLCWLFERRLLVSIVCSTNFFLIFLSNIFIKCDVRDIGLLLAASDLSPFLNRYWSYDLSL